MAVTFPSVPMPSPLAISPARPARMPAAAVAAAGIGRGSGVLAGTHPDGLTTIEGAPTEAFVRVITRSPKPEVNGIIVAEVPSAPDGTWEVPGMNENMMFDVVARKDTYNDAMVSQVVPYVPPHLVLREMLAGRHTPLALDLMFAGGEAPYTSTVVSGTLPTGLTLVANQIVGTATDAVGKYVVGIEVDDARGDNPTTRSFTVYVEQPPLYLFADGFEPYYLPGDPVDAVFVARGGEPPYTYAITAGSLPAGVSFNTSTGAITGTPTASGAFTITVTDDVADTYDAEADIVYGVLHAYWRIDVTAVSSHCSITEIEMAATTGGADQCVGGTVTASGSYAGAQHQAPNAFDGVINDATSCWASDVAGSGWIQYQFPAPVAVAEIRMVPRNTYSQYPTAFTIQSSDDGSTWTTEATYSGLTSGWATHVFRTFAV